MYLTSCWGYDNRFFLLACTLRQGLEVFPVSFQAVNYLAVPVGFWLCGRVLDVPVLAPTGAQLLP